MNELPKDTIHDIFSRVPCIKSLARFRCVCKLWTQYINDPCLENLRVKQEPTPLMFQQFRFVKPHRRCLLSSLRLIHDTTTTSIVAKTEPVLEYYVRKMTTFIIPRNPVLGCCNGLLLVYPLQDHHSGNTLNVINPLSKKLYKLPPINSVWQEGPIHVHSGGIGFDDSTNTFKIICVIRKEHAFKEKLCTIVHVLGSGFWDEMPMVQSYPISGEGIFANGCLHWLVDHLDGPPLPIDEGRKVARFEMKKAEFGSLIDPPKQKKHGRTRDQLVDLNGEVGYVYSRVRTMSVKVWILKQKEWVMHCRIDLKWHYNSNNYEHICVSGCWNKDGDILMTAKSGKQMLVYNLKNGDIYEIQRDGCKAAIHMYRSSLISIQHKLN